MNSRLKLAGICFAAAFALAACGGGGSPLDEARSERTAAEERAASAEAARAAAEAARAAAEARATEAEAAREAAEAAQAAAEARATAAEAAQAAAEAAQATAEAAQEAAEAAQMAAEAAQVAAEARATAAEAAQATAEAAQLAAEARATAAEQGTAEAIAAAEAAEAAQMAAEEAQTAAEMRASEAEAAQTAAEMRASDAEAAQTAAEEAQTTAETRASEAEAAQTAAETRATEAEEALAQAEREKQEAEEAARMAEETARMAETNANAAKLYAGIGTDPLATAGVGTRTAAYDADGNIEVTIGNGGTPVDLMEDEDAMVAARHGWTGQMFTAEPDGDVGTYEAVVYSHVGEATPGAMFSATYRYDTTAVDGTNTELIIDTTTAGVAGRVDSPSFDQSAGSKAFELPENTVRMSFPGTYHGVPGTYYCDPTANTCTATIATNGFTLTTGTWTFKATDPETRLMESPDAIYASYGWWLHKSEDDLTYTASAFHAYRGTDAGTVGIADLRGMARYTGGAAGKYALRGDTGGTNDAGHFTADVTLDATFGADHMISGTVSNFTGGDGMSRDWTVGLNASVISDTGAIAGDPEDSTDTDPQMTVWTIDGTAGDADGSWSGTLREQGDDGVPGIVTGTFHATYGHGGNDGRMVGAFGANE